MTRKTIGGRIDETYEKMTLNVCEKLEKQEVLSGTADCWTKSKRSYLGMTADWINEVTLEREFVALACRRIRGSHRVFLENEDPDAGAENESEDENDEDDIEMHFLADILDNPGDGDDANENEIILPPHYICGSHSLNRVAVGDSEAALQSKKYEKLSKSAFFKCEKLWRKQNKASKSADKIKEILGFYFNTPNLTRWNSTYDSADQLVKISEKENGLDKLNRCFDACGLQRLTLQEVQFLREYCKVM
ncbi:uncharacterized protein LOC117167698 isoform X2 [Belonocnema kinseyi]|uniref:uncharacterized protein LOC117167698 isoform X2 n=1 Tax=Belonocnema kinseyi TaxID=2817044 RepID=UPI00143D42DC|nr:uncharacterized protein LOC117167698 isoform X2 [Belonocnema kinseyi]